MIFILIAQLEEATKALEYSTKYSGETFLASMVILAALLLLSLIIYTIVVPYFKNRMEIEIKAAASAQENSAQLSRAVSTAMPIISRTHDVAVHTSEVGDVTGHDMKQMKAILRVGIHAIEKIAKQSGVDISDELARIHEILLEDLGH